MPAGRSPGTGSTITTTARVTATGRATGPGGDGATARITAPVSTRRAIRMTGRGSMRMTGRDPMRMTAPVTVATMGRIIGPIMDRITSAMGGTGVIAERSTRASGAGAGGCSTMASCVSCCCT